MISDTAIPLRFQTAEVGVDWLQCNIECQEGCPVNTNCRGYLMLAAEGRFEEGYILARDPNPVAAICGYVCSAPCEKACRRGDIDKPLAIRAMKRFLVDWHYGNNMPDNVVVQQPSGRSVAIAELLEGDVAADFDVVVELHAVLGDPVDVELDDVARQPEGRHTDEGRAAAGRQRLVDVHLVTPGAELLGGGESGRARTDDGHAAAAGRRDDDVVRHVVAVVPVDQEALHRADRERLVDVGAAAGLLAGRGADVAADRRDRVRVAGEDVALLEAALGGQHQVAAAIGIDRAAFLAFDVALKPIDADFGGLEPQWYGGIADHDVVVALSGRR